VVYDSVTKYAGLASIHLRKDIPMRQSLFMTGNRFLIWLLIPAFTFVLTPDSKAQDKGTLHPAALPPLAHPEDPATPAKALFGRETTPAPLAARAIGFYSRGCLAGAKALAVDGPTWQVMRVSRDRYWGHPDLIAFIERFSKKVPQVSHWPGILVGDMSQPRGGPMITGHASHQIGLTPMPENHLPRETREEMMATNVVREDRLDVDLRKWTPDHLAVIKAAAQDGEVERIFVNAAIKKALCREATGDRSWLAKVRPYYGHDYHFHVRIACPRGEDACEGQEPVGPGDGCDASLAHWFSESILHPRPSPAPTKPPPALTLAQLPAACRSMVVVK
jgi:penicillin-insensitive murein endopeptidase